LLGFNLLQSWKKEKLRRQWKALPAVIEERSHFGAGYLKPPPPKEKEKINEDQEGCRLDLKSVASW
jgi:hypothetical protein